MKHWFIKTNNKTVGPVSSEQLRQWVADGTVLRTTMVRSNESEDFVPADKLKGLFKSDSVALDQGRTDRRSGANPTTTSIKKSDFGDRIFEALNIHQKRDLKCHNVVNHD